tara:strand:- start:1011 stop:1199 length:189 start_codon:yes stop_codon:yes gene_type:complete
MARIRWERNKDGKLVPYKPKKFNFADSSVNNHINMRNTWSGQTKVEFSQTTMDQDIKDRNNR